MRSVVVAACVLAFVLAVRGAPCPTYKVPAWCLAERICGWCNMSGTCYDTTKQTCCVDHVCDKPQQCCKANVPWTVRATCCSANMKCCLGANPSCCPLNGTCCSMGPAGHIVCCAPPYKCLNMCCKETEFCHDGKECCKGMCMPGGGCMYPE